MTHAYALFGFNDEEDEDGCAKIIQQGRKAELAKAAQIRRFVETGSLD